MTQFTPEDQALVDEFEAAPFGRASRRLREMINLFRSMSMVGKYCLVPVQPHVSYQLARTSGIRGQGPTVIDNTSFSSPLEAEVSVFKLRLRELREAEASALAKSCSRP